MRPVVLQLDATLDGFVHDAKGYEDWWRKPEEDAVMAWKVDSLVAPLRLVPVEPYTRPSSTAVQVYRACSQEA